MADNPGCSKAAVVRGFIKEASRITVLNRLDTLEVEDYIVTRKDKPNSQIYKIFLNENNLLVTETADLEHFKKVFSEMLETLVTRSDQLEMLWHKVRRQSPPHEYLKPSDLILPIYSHLMGVYIAKSVEEWPKKIKDPDALKHLYQHIFTQLYEIESFILDILGRIGKVQRTDFNLLPAIFNNSFLFTPERLDTLVYVFDRYNFINEATPVIDSLWKTCSGFLYIFLKPYQNKYPELKSELLKDWKEFLKVWRVIKEKYGLRYSAAFPAPFLFYYE